MYHITLNTLQHTQWSCIATILGEVTLYLCPQDGWTALHLAAQEGKVDVVRLLTKSQALVNIQTEVHIHAQHVNHISILFSHMA